jgi:hypothetical protein
MSIISHLLSIRTLNYLSKPLLRSTNLFIQNHFLLSTLPSSNKTDTQSNILPKEIPSSEKKKTQYNISWKSKLK